MKEKRTIVVIDHSDEKTYIRPVPECIDIEDDDALQNWMDQFVVSTNNISWQICEEVIVHQKANGVQTVKELPYDKGYELPEGTELVDNGEFDVKGDVAISDPCNFEGPCISEITTRTALVTGKWKMWTIVRKEDGLPVSVTFTAPKTPFLITEGDDIGFVAVDTGQIGIFPVEAKTPKYLKENAAEIQENVPLVRTGYGDGIYDIRADYNEDDEINRISIEFIKD